MKADIPAVKFPTGQGKTGQKCFYARFLYVTAAMRQNSSANPDNAAYCIHRSATVPPFR